jgi:hypothetical protein
MVKVNGEMVPASGSFMGKAQVSVLDGRKKMLKDLTHKTLQKRGNFDFDKLKSTFQTTDLNSKEKKKTMDADMEQDALAQDVEGLGADSDDSDFDPEN